MRHLLIQPFILLIRLYQLLVSPLLGPRCRYYPTCSTYAQQALRQHGLGYGSLLTARRIIRCHPGCEGGHDPVPPADGQHLSNGESV